MQELIFEIDFESKTVLYMQIYNFIRSEILTSNIEADEKLPSIRKLSKQLNISTITVNNAYQQLIEEGYIESRDRSGMFVLKIKEDVFKDNKKDKKTLPQLDKVEHKYRYDFDYGLIDTASFDFALWRKVSSSVMQSFNDDLLQYNNSQGELGLRKELCKYLRSSRGVSCDHNQIVITSGTRESAQLISYLSEDKEKKIAFENPGWTNIQYVFGQNNFEVSLVDLDENGISLEKLKELSIKDKIKYVYTTPSHHFPLGTVMSIGRRRDLLKWSNVNDAYVIEDDYDSEFKYKGSTIPSLQGLDTNGRVIYLGTFSKSFSPSLRISYMVLPDNLLRKYFEIRPLLAQSSSRINQKIVEEYMKQGYWERHLRKMRKIYYKKYLSLNSSMQRYFKFDYKVIGGNAGLHLIVEFNNHMSEETIIELSKSVGVKMYSAKSYWVQNNKHTNPVFIFGFGSLSEYEIEESIRLLGHVLSN